MMPYILKRLFTDEKKCQLPIRKLVDPSQLRMKDRDEFLDVLSSWNKSADFKMGELRCLFRSAPHSLFITETRGLGFTTRIDLMREQILQTGIIKWI